MFWLNKAVNICHNIVFHSYTAGSTSMALVWLLPSQRRSKSLHWGAGDVMFGIHPYSRWFFFFGMIYQVIISMTFKGPLTNNPVSCQLTDSLSCGGFKREKVERNRFTVEWGLTCMLAGSMWCECRLSIQLLINVSEQKHRACLCPSLLKRYSVWDLVTSSGKTADLPPRSECIDLSGLQ